jgi:mono/diheme cytochrome c family protein
MDPAPDLRTVRWWLVAALLGLAWPTCLAQAQLHQPMLDLKAPAIIAEGQRLFNRSCAGQCHGRDGQDGFNGPILLGRAYLDPPYVFVTLSTGRPGSAMPPWTGRLPDDELWKIIAFVSSLGDQARAAGAK